MPRVAWLGLVVAGVVAAGCDGKALYQQQNPDGTPAGTPLPVDAEVTPGGMHRLTRDEYDNTLRDLLGDTTNPGSQKLPEDVTDPFDNDYKNQLVSGALIESVETLAQEASARALADPAKRAALVPCTPTGPEDADCLRQFITRFGRRALRHTLSEEEVTKYLGLQALAVEANDFWVGVDLVIRAMLQDPQFLYRIEIGTPVEGRPGVYRLSNWEIATRLSYFLWGTTPPDWLLDLAERGELSTSEQIREAAVRLLDDPRAQTRIDRFHALWFGYHKLPHPADLTAAMRRESFALVKKVVFDDRSDYFDLFRSDVTWADDFLATHYGLPAPGSDTPQWISYGSSGRKGILSHGSVLSQGAKFSDTSPTQRGIWVRTRLLCQNIPPPPPNANTDNPPTAPNGSNCKKDRYASHATVGSCAACHQKTDPIGFGLEQYDKAGRFRVHDDGDPNCPIDGEGRIAEMGTFNGPAGLADMLIASGQLERCVVTQLFRFANGRREIAQDATFIDQLTEAWKARDRHFDELLLAFVSDPTFQYRREE
ncbi:MAG: DUF1588 domain-containing protein [Myxococcaceae bacterium]|nr:DUF1588 domain-containing protein [Myxococcaceae bacterium]